jgi:phosphoglycolate phosphatase
VKPRSLIIFDLDGTLSDSFPWFLRVVNGVADRYAFRRIEPDEVEALRGKSSRELIRHLRVPAWKLPRIAAEMRRLKAQSLGDIPLFQGVPDMLEALAARGKTLALVTSDSAENARRALGASAQLIAHYDCGVSLFGKAKKFTRVLKAANVAAVDALCIGDEVRDAEAAAKAGIDFAAVAWGYATVEALEAMGPAAVFGSVGEIAARL